MGLRSTSDLFKAGNISIVASGKRRELKLWRLRSSLSTYPRSAELRRKSDCHKCLRFSSPRRFLIQLLPSQALRDRCRRDPLRREFPSSGLSFLLPLMYALFELCNRNREDNKPGGGRKSCGDRVSMRYAGRSESAGKRKKENR